MDVDEDDDFYYTMPIEDWLDGPYAVYVQQFQDAGYDDTTFLMGMKEPDLIEIGIENRGHRKKILSEINRLPPEEIDQDVPVSKYTVTLANTYVLHLWFRKLNILTGHVLISFNFLSIGRCT